MRTALFCVLVILFAAFNAGAQPLYDYTRPFLATSQLGFPEGSPKEVTFYAGEAEEAFPDVIPFFITPVGYRLPREKTHPQQWEVEGNVFRWPFNDTLGRYSSEVLKPGYGKALYAGTLVRMETGWGTIWRADFTDFMAPGVYQIENEYGFTAPFVIGNDVYQKMERGYLEFLFCQRSGVEIPGVRPAENADDGRLYSDPDHYLPVAGGWNDAGDWRKWLSLTQPNLDALGQVATHGHPAFRLRALEEMEWGNRYYHHMITDKGRVYEDVGGGRNRAGEYGDSWWNENHPGVTAAGDLESDNVPMNGVERHVRDNYNPMVQFQFARHQAAASVVMPHPHKSNCLVVASRAWKYGESAGHDNRTLYLSQQLLAAVELTLAGSPVVETERIGQLAGALLERQEVNREGLSGYFMEKDKVDGYRSIVFSCEPAMALLRLAEAAIPGLEEITGEAVRAVTTYIEEYLLEDAATNPFGIPPYGVYTRPPYPESQSFRKFGRDRYVRTFIHVFSDDPIPHGVNQVFLQQAYLMARAGKLFGRGEWQQAAERIIAWSMGHNPYGLCLFTGVGFRHPVAGSFVNYKIPSAPAIGFMGTPDDRPYLETRNLVEWSTQEVWDAPFYYLIGAISFLR